jgi:hypothetical protein
MAYSPTYTSTDLGPIAIDGIGTVGASMVTLAVLVGLVFVWRFATGKKMGI